MGGSSSVPAVPSASNSFRHTWAGSTPRIRMELEVRIGNTGEITAAVVRRELDFAFVGSPPQDDELIAEPVSADEVIAFVAPGDPLLREAPIDPAALSGRQFVLRERGSATRDLALHCLAAAGRELDHVIELGSNEAVKRAVEAGLGIGLLSTHAIEAERLTELLVDLHSRVGSAAGRSGSSGVVTACPPGLSRRSWHCCRDRQWC